ncbi:MAG: heme peroxidase family protein [Pseudomonadota bacterium]|nr:heme peroxidase family protein [Pseudomonadota bacterium]
MTNPDHHGMKTLEGLSPYCVRSEYGIEQRDDRFGRMFGELMPAYTDPHILIEIGRVGGAMEAPNDSDRTASVPVGQVFFGQFVDHDITLDASTTFDSVVDNPGEIANVRTPTLDLDCIYGLGPEAQPYLFEQGGDFGGVRLLTGADNPGQNGVPAHDLLRGPNNRAIIGDPRNDENRIISQIQLAIIRFHNHVATTINAEEGITGHDLYEVSRTLTTWHYQWAVVNDFLSDMCGKAVIERILGCGRQHYCGDVPFIPVEFSVAAYRFGHSMVPLNIQVQRGQRQFALFGAGLGRGFDPVPSNDAVADMHELFFTPENRQVQRTQKLDTLMSAALLDLPFVDGSAAEKSLATRNLMRGNTFLLPAGEKVAGALERPQAEIDQVIAKIADLNGDLGAEGIPLWLYLLAEAEVIGREESDGSFAPGEGLGPVGATIVAEVIIGLLELDEHSFLGANRNWVPREEWNTLGKLLTVAQPAIP